MVKTGANEVARVLCSVFDDSIRTCRTLLRAGGRNSQADAGMEYACLDTPTVMQTLKAKPPSRGELMRVLEDLSGLLTVAIRMSTSPEAITLSRCLDGNKC
jgi:hypothetical protein